MPTRLSIIHTNQADAGTLSVSPAENASFPVANLKTQFRGETLRTTGLSAQQLRAVWPATVSISAIALCRHNLTAAATWRVRLYSDAAFTTSVYDSGSVTAYDNAGMGTLDAINDASFREYKNSVLWISATNARSMTIDLTDAGNSDGYLEAARLFAGPYTELTRNFDWDHTLTLVSKSSQGDTFGGSTTSSWGGPIKRELELPMSMLPQTDRDFIFDLIRTKDVNGDFFLSAWPGRGGKETRDYQGWAKLKSWQGIARPLLNYYGSSVTAAFC
jgi:hypothetical protein